MAGDFVIVQHATPRKPEVLRLATSMGIDPPHAFGLCVIAWMWFDEQTEDGRALGATEAMLDAVVCRAGFARTLSDVGWLSIRNGALEVPNFDRLMGQSAKKRSKNTKRQQKRRHASVADLSRGERDKSATKEEKRREEKNIDTTVPLLLQSPAFECAWKAWEQHRREIKKPLTPSTAVAQLKMLAKVGHDQAIAMIEHTITKGWTGLQAPDEHSKPPPPKPPPVNAPPPPKRVTPINPLHDPYTAETATPTRTPPPPIAVAGDRGHSGDESVVGANGGTV